jgi:putative ABC transport system permease protein
MGRNLLIAVPGQRRPGTLVAAPNFQVDDAVAIHRDVEGLSAVAPAVSRSAVAVAGNRNRTTQVTGTTNDFFTAREWRIATGRTFSLAEDRSGKSVCVLGETVRHELFGTQDPVGSRIRVDKISCDVVGVLSPKGQSTFGQDQDDLLVMPLKTVQRRLAGNTDVNMIWMSVSRASETARVEADVERLLRERRHVIAGAADDFQVSDMQEVTRMVETTTGILTAFLSAVAAVSLLVGGIGIMNIMLVSVTERTREIGIRMAIGATPSQIMLQFLVEALSLSAIGGLLGVLTGVGAGQQFASRMGLPLVVRPDVIALAVVFSGLVGVGFGLYPAVKASRLDPIDALRFE